MHAHMPAPVAELTVGRDAYAAVFEVPSRQGGLAVDASVLDRSEHERMAAFVHAHDRLRYGYAHMLLRVLIGDHLQQDPASLRFSRDKCPCCGALHGRPVLNLNGPRPLEFSLSHGGDHVMIGIAAMAIGVDVAPLPQSRTVQQVARSLHLREQQAIAETRVRQRAGVFNRLWVRKEAYLKGLGTGLARDLNADDLTHDPSGWLISDRAVDSRHHAAVALKRADARQQLTAGGAGSAKVNIRWVQI